MCHILDKDICLCGKCLNEFDPKFIKFQIDDYKAMSIYEYTPFIKNLIYTYKGCYDYELKEVFLNPFYKEISLRYKKYKIIPAPSYFKDDEKRGFNHVVEAFKTLGLDVLQIVIKTAHHKQAENNSKKRKDIKKYLALKNEVSLKNKRVLLVDDIYTTGATMRAMIKLIEKLKPKEIRVLVLAKTRDQDYKKVNSNNFYY